MKKKPKIGLMIDLETYGTNENCVIRQIAMVSFDFEGLEKKEALVTYPDVGEQENVGRSKSKATLAWWQNVAKETDKELAEKQKDYGRSCNTVAVTVRDWISDLKKGHEVYIIARGATTFDFPILSNFIEQFTGAPLKHPFYRILDLRSFTSIFKAITGNDLVSQDDVKHDGYDDCIEQIQQLARFKRDYLISS